MFNSTTYENSRHDGIGVLEMVSQHERAPSQPRLCVPLKRTELRGEAVGLLAALQLTQIFRDAVDANRDPRRYGSMTLNRSYILGDDNLLGIIIPAPANRDLTAGEEMHWPLHMRDLRVIPVHNSTNNRTGVRRINHGGQAYANEA